MNDSLKRPPTQQELYRKTHISKDGSFVDNRSEEAMESYDFLMSKKYGEDISMQPRVDFEVWNEASGGMQKNRVLGYGNAAESASIMGCPITSNNAHFLSDMAPRGPDEMIAMEQRIEASVRVSLHQDVESIVRSTLSQFGLFNYQQHSQSTHPQDTTNASRNAGVDAHIGCNTNDDACDHNI